MKLKLHVWRQNGADDKGKLETYDAPNVSPDQSRSCSCDLYFDRRSVSRLAGNIADKTAHLKHWSSLF